MTPVIPFHAELRRKIEALLEDKSAMILNGIPKTYEDYRYHVGILEGCRQVIGLAAELEAKIMKADKGDRD